MSTDAKQTDSNELVRRAQKLEASLRKRDWIEAGAALFVISGFGWFLWSGQLPLIATIGIGIIMLGALESVIVLQWAQRCDREPTEGTPLNKFCEAELKRFNRQIRLLHNVTWWYTGPMILGCCIFVFGLLYSLVELPPLIFYGFLSAFFACFYAVVIIIKRINQRSAEKELIPLCNELADLQKSL